MATDAPAAAEPTPAQWSQQLSQLRAENEQLQRRRADAEKDRDLFRELYGTASAHASAVSSENNALAERAAVAEGQARDGLAMLRAAYDERVRLLEAEAARWRAQCEVLAGRDARTDDEVRRRAAREPELADENERLRAELRVLEKDYRRMEVVVEVMTKQQVEESAVLESAAISATPMFTPSPTESL